MAGSAPATAASTTPSAACVKVRRRKTSPYRATAFSTPRRSNWAEGSKKMTTQAKDSWMSTRLPYLGIVCATYLQRNRAANAPYFAAFPFLISVAAAFLTLSGIVLAVYYNPWHAFASVQFIDRNVNNGWLIRAYHATGTTMIFGLTYLYLFRGILRRAYRAPGEFVWMLSAKLLAVLLLTGWLGFVLTGGA